ncbi:MAG: sulfotransferase [Bacteroidota bacterium]
MVALKNTSLNFILSTGRTGSTLLSSMLNMHPKILSVSEEPFAYNLYPKYKNVTNWTDKTIEQFCYDFYLFSEGKLEPQFGKKDDIINLLKEHRSVLTGENAIKLAYFAFFPNKDKSQVNTIVDKELKFHHFLNEVADFYPTAKFIMLCRDPRDNVLVKIKRAIKKKKKPNTFFLAKVWNYEYTTLNKKLSILDKDRYIKVKYEDLVEKPEEILKKITSFLNLPYNQVMLNYDENIKEEVKRNESAIGDTVKQHLSLFHEGLTQKVNTEKVNLWKKELSHEENDLIWSICEKTALSNGYIADGCKTVPYFKPGMIKQLLKFHLDKNLTPYIYYSLPYSIKYFIKKVKYGKNLKNGTWATRDFYKTTYLPNNSLNLSLIKRGNLLMTLFLAISLLAR